KYVGSIHKPDNCALLSHVAQLDRSQRICRKELRREARSQMRKSAAPCHTAGPEAKAAAQPGAGSTGQAPQQTPEQTPEQAPEQALASPMSSRKAPGSSAPRCG